MESQIINLYPLDRRMKYQSVLLFILGIIYIVIGSLYLFEDPSKYYRSLILLVTGFGILISSFFIFFNDNNKNLSLDDEKN